MSVAGELVFVVGELVAGLFWQGGIFTLCNIILYTVSHALLQLRSTMMLLAGLVLCKLGFGVVCCIASVYCSMVRRLKQYAAPAPAPPPLSFPPHPPSHHYPPNRTSAASMQDCWTCLLKTSWNTWWCMVFWLRFMIILPLFKLFSSYLGSCSDSVVCTLINMLLVLAAFPLFGTSLPKQPTSPRSTEKRRLGRWVGAWVGDWNWLGGCWA